MYKLANGEHSLLFYSISGKFNSFLKFGSFLFSVFPYKVLILYLYI